MQVVDFVTAPVPAELAALGLGAVPYTGSGRPSQRWYDDCRARAVAIPWMIQETISTRSQQGFQAGVFDCEFAQRRCREVGHAGAICAVVSDGNGGDRWDASGYGQGWRSVATVPYFPYGALGVTGSFLAGSAGPLLIMGEWVPETWGAGRIASQLVGPQANLSTPHDLNNVFYDFGSAPTTKRKVSEDMILIGNRKGKRECWLAIGSVLAQQFTEPAQDVFGLKVPADAVRFSGNGEIPIREIADGVLDTLEAIAQNGLNPPAGGVAVGAFNFSGTATSA